MNKPSIAVVMGSKSDLTLMQPCSDLLRDFGVACQVKVLSAHRQPERLVKYVKEAQAKGIKVFIAAAGGAAALAGVIAAHTTRAVIGVPIETKSLKGLDSLLSVVQMPTGVPVACMAIGKAGPKNAAIFALQILAIQDKKIAKRLVDYKRGLARHK